jgi:hypothetical protein
LHRFEEFELKKQFEYDKPKHHEKQRTKIRSRCNCWGKLGKGKLFWGGEALPIDEVATSTTTTTTTTRQISFYFDCRVSS